MQHPDSFPISTLKIRVPHWRRKWVSRPRLLEALHDDLEKQLLLVVAPAGYGKTTLLVNMAHNSELPVCWLSLDTLDKEPQRFLNYFIAAIAEKYPEFGKDSIAALKTMKSFESDGENVLVTLTNEIEEKIDDHFIVMLDDYHIVGDTLIIRQILNRLLQLVGENFHLILASRNLPDFPDIPRLVMLDLVGGLSYEELAFTPKEVQKIFLEDSVSNLSPEDAEALVRETEGWIAAIKISGGKAGTLSNIDPLRSTRELFDYFDKEILARQSKNIQRFLLLTSFFDRFDISLCEEVLTDLLGGEELVWTELFTVVQTQNLFSVLVDENGRWMRYHHLFQHFLKSKLRYDEPVLAWHIQQNLAKAYEKQMNWEDALQIYDHLDDHKNFLRLLVHVGPIFIREGRILTLASWLERLPMETIYAQPALLSLQGAVFLSKEDIAKAIDFFSLAEEKFRSTEENTELALTLVRRAEALRHLGQFDRALVDAEEAIELTKEENVPVLETTYAEALRIKGLSYFGQGKLRKALSWLNDALRAYRLLSSTDNIPILETEIGVVYRRLGEPDVAARYYASALRAWEDAGNTEWKARLLNNLGLLHHMTGHLEEALPLLEKSLDVTEKGGHTWLQANEFVSLGDLWTDLGDFEIAHEYYDQALTLATQLGASLLIFHATFGDARLKCIKGELLQAMNEYRQAETSQTKLGRYEKAILNIERGVCLAKLGEVKQALQVFQLAVSLLNQNQNEMEQASAQLWMNVISYENDAKTATKSMKAIVPNPKNWEFATPLMLTAGKAGNWLKERGYFPLEDPLLNDFFRHAKQLDKNLLHLREKLRRLSSRVVEPAKFEFLTFGNMQAVKDGHKLQLSDWQTREAKELFFFLLQAPPISKEKVALVFWPDITPARLKMRFKINIYRIRQALGRDVILFENGRYRYNQGINYQWDREVFDILLQDAHESSNRLELLSQALELVQGSYMADADLDWAISDRLKYEEITKRIMTDLGNAYLHEERIEECFQIGQRILEYDPLAENGHSLLLQAYAARRDQINMKRQYQDYEKKLGEELGLRPSSDFLTLYDELMQQV